MRRFLLVLVLLALAAARPAAAQQRPNIIYIMSDDHAAHAIGAYGSKVNETPSIFRPSAENRNDPRAVPFHTACRDSMGSVVPAE